MQETEPWVVGSGLPYMTEPDVLSIQGNATESEIKTGDYNPKQTVTAVAGKPSFNMLHQ